MEKKVKMNDIGGYVHQKNEAYKVINFFNDYEKHQKLGATLPKGIFFFGEPGNGKTMFANAIANESKANCFSLSENLYLKQNTAISAEIIKLFKTAKAQAPSIIIIDEIDQLINCDCGFASRSSDNEKEVLRVLLTEIDNLGDDPVLVIATGNVDIEEVPAALVRNGRIEKHIKISDPTLEDRKQILSMLLNKNEVFKNVNLDVLAKTTANCTCSGLVTLVNEVLISSIQNNEKEPTIGDFLEPLQVILTHEIKDHKEKVEESVIYHEVGHIVSDFVLSGNVGILSAEAFGKSGGRYIKILEERLTEQDPVADKKGKTKESFINDAIVGISGFVATKYFLKEDYVGSGSDLGKIKSLYGGLVHSGLFGIKLYSLNQQIERPGTLLHKKEMNIVNKHFYKFMKMIYKKSKSILKKNKDLVFALVEQLRKKPSLSPEEVKEVIKRVKAI